MELIRSSSNQCMLAAFAMYLDTTMEKLCDELGHDGTEKISSLIAEPYCRRSFHPQEFVDLFYRRGEPLIIIEKNPRMLHGQTILDHTWQLGVQRFYDYLESYDGVLCGTATGSIGHAVAYKARNKRIYDPRGYEYSLYESNDKGFRSLYFLSSLNGVL